MFFYEDDDEPQPPPLDRRRPFFHIHGAWRDELDGATIYFRDHRRAPRAVFCRKGDHEHSGDCLFWMVLRGQFIAHYRSPQEQIDGHILLQLETPDRLIGGWWHTRDVPHGDARALPFVPGVHPVRWIRQDPRRPWPLWACEALELPTDGSVTSESLLSAGPAASTAVAPADLARTVELPTSNALRIAPERTSEGRYRVRVALWTGGRGGLVGLVARARHHGWWLLHNLVAHPLLALTSRGFAVALHDWTSRRLNRDDALEPSPPPVVERRFWWIVHNLATHPAIGLVPCAATFRWHDATARRMRVAGWV